MSGRRRAVPGSHRAAAGGHRGTSRRASRRSRLPGGARAVALIAVGALATGFGPRLPAAVDSAVDGTVGAAGAGTRATGVLEGTATAPGDDARVDGPEASEVPRPTTESAEPGARRVARRPARDVPPDGPGTFRIAADSSTESTDEAPAYGELTYTVEVEDGVPFDPARTAARVERVLDHPRGWEGLLSQPLRRTTDVPDFRVLLASPATTDALCAPLDTAGYVSCRNGDLVVLNAVRWAEGVPDYEGALAQYRTYLVNHEVGHRLGQGHVECPAPGVPAPVMLQQTYGLDGCTRNAWPTPAGETG